MCHFGGNNECQVSFTYCIYLHSDIIYIVKHKMFLIYSFICDYAPFEEWRAYCFPSVCLSVCQSVGRSTNSFSFFFAEVEHTEMKFIIQIYHKNIHVRFGFGYDRAIFDRVVLLELPIICFSFIISARVEHINY